MMPSCKYKIFDPFDFSNIQEYPHKAPPKWTKHVPKFHGDVDMTSHHLLSFMEHTFKLKIEHDDVLMRLFYFSLVDDAKVWFRGLEE